jgi:hypothetical protein
MNTIDSFSVIYQPTTLFSLKDSNATNSGAKSLFIPSPYAIKMSILNQAITLDGVDFEGKKNPYFQYVRDAEITFRLNGHFCVNNCFIKILKKKEDKRGKKAKAEGAVFIPGFQNTISFREYLHLTDNLEIIVHSKSKEANQFLKKYLHKINYFGKRGCFFQFLKYSDAPSSSNVQLFSAENIGAGLLQEFDDFAPSMSFDNVNSYSSGRVSRAKKVFLLPIEKISSSKSYTHFKVMDE